MVAIVQAQLMGAVVDDVCLFDNEAFWVLPSEARSMDPQQRLLLHLAYQVAPGRFAAFFLFCCIHTL